MRIRERKAFTREERELMIVQAIMVDMQRGYDGHMTVTDIAHALKITPSTKLRLICNQMVVEGALKADTEKYPGIARKRVLYFLPGSAHHALHMAKGAAKQVARTIKINGQQVALEGF